MAFLNLSLLEFLAIFTPIAATIVALYLYDRSRRRQVVSTLRFFARQAQAPVFVRRKKIQQPWSLLLQLASLALLLLAIAEPELGRPGMQSRDHVLILETSAWMNAASPDRRASLMQTAQRRALDYLEAVPAQDRVLLVRSDGLATPVTTFTRNRRELQEAIRNSAPGATALNLPAALALAQSAQKLASTQPGEIAIVGSGRIPRGDIERLSAAGDPKLRAIILGGEPNNCGIRKLAARRSPADPLEWEVEAGVYNYGPSERRTTLRLIFAGASSGAKGLRLPAHSATDASFHLRASQPGALEAVLDAKDDFAPDNRAAVELPGLAPLRVAVYTDQPGRWRPLLTASPYLNPEFHPQSGYSPRGDPRRLVIIDGFTPASPPDADSVWVTRPAAPGAQKMTVARWDAVHPIAAGLHNKDFRTSRGTILKPAADEAVVAACDAGPVLVASSGAHKKIVFGFHPLDEGAENHLATPLLFANIVRWVSPDLFRVTEVSAGPPGLIELETEAGLTREQVQISSPQMRDIPFTIADKRLRVFAGRTGVVRVTLPERELVYSLNLPEVGELRWTPPAGTRQGVPRPGAATFSRALWPWLALAGLLGLMAEWMLYGRRPALAPLAARTAQTTTPEPEHAAEPQEVGL